MLARAHGRLDVAQPRLPGRFEPARLSGGMPDPETSETRAVEFRAPEFSPAPAPAAGARIDPVPPSLNPAAPARGVAATPLETIVAPPPFSVRSPAAEAEPEVQRRSAARDSSEPPQSAPASGAQNRVSPSPPDPEAAMRQAVARMVTRVNVVEAASRQAGETAAASEPVIHVTIGRVDVRASNPPPARPAPPPPPVEKRESLDEFLARARRG
jgi:hypothetical protein